MIFYRSNSRKNSDHLELFFLLLPLLCGNFFHIAGAFQTYDGSVCTNTPLKIKTTEVPWQRFSSNSGSFNRCSYVQKSLVFLMAADSDNYQEDEKKMFNANNEMKEENDDDDDEYLKMLTKKYLGSTSNPKPPPSFVKPATKNNARLGDLYDDDELTQLLQVHKQINEPKIEFAENNNIDDDDFPVPPSLHDLVMEAIGEIDNSSKEETENTNKKSDNDSPVEKNIESNEDEYDWLPTALKIKMRNARAIASDVDGTLIGLETQAVHPRTKDAIRKAIEMATKGDSQLRYFFPATGKSRWGAMNSLGPEIAELLIGSPGVFIQGLYCLDGNGNTIFEKKLKTSAIEAAERLAALHQGVSLVAYDGDDLYTNDEDAPLVVKLHETWGEPKSKHPDVATNKNKEGLVLTSYEPGLHKILFLCEDVDRLAKTIRPELEKLAANHDAVVTQAIPCMLELLPGGCSKADGVRRLCAVLDGIENLDEHLIAIGDAENDAGMLSEAAVGIAVGNASEQAKNAADVVVTGVSSDDGAAGVAIDAVISELLQCKRDASSLSSSQK